MVVLYPHPWQSCPRVFEQQGLQDCAQWDLYGGVVFLCAGHLIECRKGAALGLSRLVTSCFNAVNCQFLWSHFSLCCTETILHSGKVTFVTLIACIFVPFLHKDAALLSLRGVLCTAQSGCRPKGSWYCIFSVVTKCLLKTIFFIFIKLQSIRQKLWEELVVFKSYIWNRLLVAINRVEGKSCRLAREVNTLNWKWILSRNTILHVKKTHAHVLKAPFKPRDQLVFCLFCRSSLPRFFVSVSSSGFRLLLDAGLNLA